MRAPAFLNFVLKAPDRVLSIQWSVLLTLVLCVLLCMGSAIGQTLPKSGPGAQPPSTDFVPPPPPEEEVIDDSNITYTSMPSTIEAGSTATVTVTAKNLGSTTWSSASPYPYRLGSALPADNQVWGVGRVNVQSYVPFGSTITFTLNIKAPSTPGTYTFAWQMLREGMHWFGQVLSRTVTVTAPQPVYDAQITNSSIPAQMSAGGTYNVSLTFKNTGNVNWTQPRYLIGTSSPYDNQIFGPNRVGLNVPSVAPGQSATFNFQVKAPSTAGSYAFDWGMLWEHNLRFGPTTRATVAVVAAVPLPTLSTAHSPSPVAGSAFTTSWSTTNATSLTRVCTAGGTGFKVNESLPVNGQRSQTALAAWVGYPSSCTWTAVGPSGTTVRTETMRTDPAPTSTPKPTISVARTPAPVEGQSFTTTWSTTNATALSRVCTASGAGYKVNESLAVNGSRTETAVVGWAANPSTCNWTASGAGGTTTYAETMTTTSDAGGNVTYVHTDGLGSPVARTNASKQVISRTRYEPYGYVAAGAQPTIGFTGHVNDVDTGLTYMQQRYYDPVAGRFLSIDPVTTDANTGGSFNRYAYANNSPYKYIDPNGRNAVTKFIKQTIKHRGDAIQAAVDVASDVVTVVSPSSSMGDRVEAAISLISPVDVSDLKAAKSFFRGAKPGSKPDFTPKPGETKIDAASGTVKPTHGVSVFDNPDSVSSKGYVPHEVDMKSVPDSLQIQQRGSDPAHFEIMPKPGANLTPSQFTEACQSIACK